MVDFLVPAWLIGLIVIPVVWWVHRQGEPEAAVDVSAAFLFAAPAGEPETGHALPPANPLWMLRAALLGLLLLALAEPLWTQTQRHITVWFDDSLSMRAEEANGIRYAVAARRLDAALAEAGVTEAQICSLSGLREPLAVAMPAGPERVAIIERWAASGATGSLRMPVALPQNRENWLVSDGADSRLGPWLDDMPLANIIAVGTETENVAITKLMGRRSLQQDDGLEISVLVHNLGLQEADRSLGLEVGGDLLRSQELRIAAGDVVHLDFQVPARSDGVVASLSPGDALAQDDTLEISLNGLQPVVVGVDSQCGSHLGAALRAHPGLDVRTVSERNQELSVHCGRSPAPSSGSSIFVAVGGDSVPVTGRLRWHRPISGLSDLPLDRMPLRVNTESARAPSEFTLLSALEPRLSLLDLQAGSLSVFMDVQSGSIAESSQYPLLVNALVELALGRAVLDPVSRTERQLGESSIARQALPEPAVAPSVATAAGTDLAPYLVALAILLLVADILLSSGLGSSSRLGARGRA